MKKTGALRPRLQLVVARIKIVFNVGVSVLARAESFLRLPHERGARAHIFCSGAAARTQGQITNLRQYTR